jgi:hypothetical protein
VAAGHHQQHREETRQGEHVARHPGAAQAPVAGGGVGVDVLGAAVGVDDRDQPVEQRDDVDDEDRRQREGVEHEAEQLQAVHPQQHAGAQRDEQDGHGGEAERAHRRAGIELAESREDQGQERRRERRLGARSRLLRGLHRA